MLSHIAEWRNRLQQVHPDHLRIARGAIWVSIFVLFGKCAGALREMAIAYHYGISPVVDAYQLTLTLITWLPATFVVVLRVVLVPALVDLRTRTTDEQARFLGELETVTLVIGTACAALPFLAWPFALGLFARNLSAETREMSRLMMMTMFPVGILMLTICAHAARLQARERHINTLLECIPAAVVLFFLLAWQDGGSPLPLVWGTTIGFLLQAVCLGALARATDGVPMRLCLTLRSPQWSRNFRAVGVFMLGEIVLSFAAPLDQYFVAGLGDGAIATLGYASRVISLLEGVGALAIGRATLPVFSEILGSGELARARKTALKWSFMMLALGTLMLAVVWPLAPSIITLLFQRGAFTMADTVTVSNLLRWSLVQVPFYFAQLVLMQLFASEGRFKALAAIAISSFIVKVLANFVLIRWCGIEGIVLATGAMTASSFVFYLLLMRKGQHDRKTTRRAP